MSELKNIIQLLLAVSFSSCGFFGKNCKDEVLRDITQQELDFFPDYVVNDTIRYKDMINGEDYHLVCYEYEINLRKRIFHEVHECAGNGYNTTYDEVYISLGASFPKDNAIEILYASTETNNLYIMFVQTMVFTYDYADNRIYPKPLTYYKTGFYDKVKINNTEYSNVHLLVPDNLYYDSIFYNSEFGFLRFVSTEGNLDIVLDQ